ncbi:glycoside hydrolase family 3 C-terminal domain-containing protein [Paenibacillus filicis]|uniref:Glycoside hydrolase family 3 C-terminal domain-containing protein n=1 Tax=Paenibacillus filicis TaxID=669464 RepID=A0ABU9DES4_9BACL
MKSYKQADSQSYFKFLIGLMIVVLLFTPFGYSRTNAQALPGFPDVARQAAAEGIVLLQNPDYKVGTTPVNAIEKVLPIQKSERVSVFGRIQATYYKSGTGSGGAVRVDYVNGILEGLRNNPSIRLNEDLVKVYADWIKLNPFNNGGGGWAAEPWSQAEMPLTTAILDQAKVQSDTAVVIIGRTAGEDKDNTNTKGAYQLTDLEVDMLNKVYAKFDRVSIVLNVANVIDMSWAKNYPKAAIVYAWQGGMEGGSAVADVLTGDVTPSGKLSDTIAASLADYPSTAYFGSSTENKYFEDIYVGYRYFETFAPDKVLYPFGFGLSYTNFQITTDKVEIKEAQHEITVQATVKNTGKAEGKEVVQVYFGAPQGLLGKPAKQLIGFAKTGVLQPGASQTVSITFDINDMASYDDSGITGHDSSYVLEAGSYQIYVGNSVRSADKQGEYKLAALKVVKELQEALAPTRDFKRLKTGTQNPDGTFTRAEEAVPQRNTNLANRIQEQLPPAIPQTGNKGYKLLDVYNKTITMDQFVAQLSNNDLAALTMGEGMSSPKVTPGTAAAFGGVTNNLLNFGVPLDSAADGPSGIRMETNAQKATSIPNGTMLASTWNLEINERLFYLLGKEMLLNNIDTVLGPGVNIHRNPLNGRNFEYFSEDPLLTGMMAIAQTRGLQHNGAAPTIKHFVANNQETARHTANALVSERALREIYLKGYEMAVKSGKARSIMTSYGPVNGTWTSSSYDLNTTILRKEWGFDGIVMTDWWARLSEEQGYYTNNSNETNGKAMIRAQNDLYMVIPDGYAETIRNRGGNTMNILTSLSNQSLTLGELQRSAKNILGFLIKSPAFARTAKIPYQVDYTPGKDWFRVDTAKPGDPQLSGIKVGGKRIKSFNPLVLDYKAYGSAEVSTYPVVQGEAGNGATVTVVQATPERPAAVITVTAGGEKRIYKVIFSSAEGLEPIFENPTYAYLKSVKIDGVPIEGFAETRLNYDVGLNSITTLPKVTFESNPGVTGILTEDAVNRRVTIKAVSSDQANTYVVQFGKLPQSDEFNTATLSPFWKINTETSTNSENKANWSLDPARGTLRIIAERGDFWRDHADLKNYFQQEAFGNWEATVKVNTNKPPSENYNGFGITASQDNNNYIWLKYEFSSNKIIGMTKEVNGAEPVTIGQLSASQINSLVGDKTEIYLRLKKLGNVYSGYVSVDGTNYISVGSTTASYANPKFGLLASNGSTTLTQPFYADFDYVRFQTDVNVATKNIGINTKLKAAETEAAAITPAIASVACNDVDGGLCYTNNNKGEEISYKLNVEQGGKYKITSRLRSSQSEVAQMSFGVYDNGNLLGTFDLTTTKGEWRTFSIPDVNLTAGPHTLKIVFESSGIDLNWLKFQLYQDQVDVSALSAAIQAAQALDLNAYTAYKKTQFNAVLDRIKPVLNNPINQEAVAESVTELNAAIAELKRSTMPVNIQATFSEDQPGVKRIYPYNAPWIFTSNTGFRFETGTDAMSYVNSNDLVYLGKLDLNKLVEIKVRYSREGGQPYFLFFTEADNTGSPVKRSTTQGRAYNDVYSGGSFIMGKELASINLAQKASSGWAAYGVASTKQVVGDNTNIDRYLGDATNFLDRTQAKGSKDVYMRFNGTNANLQYIELVYDNTLPDYVDVAFNLNYAGSPAPSTVSVIKGAALAAQLPAPPVREGYTFNGWFATADGNGDAITADTVITQNQTFYAKWTKNSAERTIKSVVQPQAVSVDWGTAFNALPLPSSVQVQLDNEEVISLPVTWKGDSYNGQVAKTYVIEGVLTLQNGIGNPNALQASISVTVQPDRPVPPSVTLSGPASVKGNEPFDLVLGLQNASQSVYAQDLTLTFDPQQVEFDGAEELIEGLKIVGQSKKAGQIRLLTANLGAGDLNAPLLKLKWRAASASQPTSTVITLSQAIMADGHGVETASPSVQHQLQIAVATDNKVLKQLIDSALEKHRNATEGTSAGQYPVGSKAALLTAIQLAKAVADDASATQEQINQAAVALQQALSKFLDSVITRNPGDTNGDGRYSIGDLAIVAAAYGKTSADPDWDLVKHADVNNDGKIDIEDLAIVAQKILQ